MWNPITTQPWKTIMKNPLRVITILSMSALLASGHQLSRAGDTDFDIGTRFRAKIAKEKVKQNIAKANNFNFNQANGQNSADCGSQNIGNIDTGGRIGAAPREVFVFAPNAINLVSGQGCR